MKKFILTMTLCAIFIAQIQLLAQNPKAVYYEKQEIELKDFNADGFILDIGGGGEGVIGQLKGNQVVSIDPYIEELVNAPSTNLKIVMDGRELKFLDNTFNTAAIFYTLMYIDGADHKKVFNEVKRVLKHGGKLMIWDVNLPVSQDTSKYYGVYRFKFKLPKTEINTGYGARFPKKTNQNMEYYLNIAKKTGFRVIKAQSNEPSFYIELQTPPAITDTLAEIIDLKGIDFAINNYNQLKVSKSNEYYFGVDALISLSSQYLLSDKAKEATEIFKLAINNFEIEEHTINSFGYKLLNKMKNKEALEIFKINVKKFPLSSNAYDSLAEAYMLDNQKEPALKNYQKALELNPSNGNAEKMIKKLSNN